MLDAEHNPPGGFCCCDDFCRKHRCRIRRRELMMSLAGAGNGSHEVRCLARQGLEEGQMRPVAGRGFFTVDEWTIRLNSARATRIGRYRFVVPRRNAATVTGGFALGIAKSRSPHVAKDLGAGWEEGAPSWREIAPRDEVDYATFHLAADTPIAGRIVDAAGKPVAGDVMSVDAVHVDRRPLVQDCPSADQGRRREHEPRMAD